MLPVSCSTRMSWSSAFRDHRPVAPVHVLVVPNKHIASVNDLTAEDEPLMGHLFTVARQLAQPAGRRPERVSPGGQHRPARRAGCLPPAPAPARWSPDACPGGKYGLIEMNQVLKETPIVNRQDPPAGAGRPDRRACRRHRQRRQYSPATRRRCGRRHLPPRRVANPG